MAISKCGSCQGTRFELKEAGPAGAQFKINFIQCSACGVVVGVTDYFNVPAMTEQWVKNAAAELSTQIQHLESRLSALIASGT